MGVDKGDIFYVDILQHLCQSQSRSLTILGRGADMIGIVIHGATAYCPARADG